MHTASFEKMREFVGQYLEIYREKELKILDVGSCDINGSYRPLFAVNRWQYRGLDVAAGKNVDIIVKDIYRWKEIRNNTYDVVISGQAFEHIEYFWLTMQEIARVMKTGGLCCIIAPSSGFVHKYPLDCWRFYSDGLLALARYVELEVIEVHTENQPEAYGEPNIWQDSILVAKKPHTGIIKKIRQWSWDKASY
jgi:SAM-dependent methyltransferase